MASNRELASETVLLLLHGLGATGAVWHGVAREFEKRADLTILAPDHLGHGAGAPAAPYTVEKLATAAFRHIPGHRRLFVVGHSMGGYVALALAGGGFGVQPQAILSIGAKLNFSDVEKARGADLASKPVRWFTTREEAEERYRLVSGLPKAQFPQDWCIERGVTSGDGGFHLAADPAVFGIVVPPFAELLSDARCPVHVARGEHDSIVSREECVALGREFDEYAGLGHNAQVEDPVRVARAIMALLEA
jgi:pimeloyl-ACP methyl ester carboxylesterase